MKRTRFALLSLVVALLVLPAVSTAQEDAASLMLPVMMDISKGAWKSHF